MKLSLFMSTVHNTRSITQMMADDLERHGFFKKLKASVAKLECVEP